MLTRTSNDTERISSMETPRSYDNRNDDVSSPPVSWVRGKCVGRGCFGTVNVAVKKSDGRVFAVKSVDLDTCLPGQIESLENEIRILRSLSGSPYVVGILGEDVTASYRNLHMEYLPGGTVADMASTSSRLGADVDELLLRRYTWCVVSALRHVHSRGFVHCDVKGKNILVGPSYGAAKLADFGSAMELTRGVARSAAPIVPRGSPLWMAPEVIRREYQGPESDIWSLGCTVIEMLTGKPAWEDRGFETLSRIGFSEELPRFPTQLSELGRDFLDKCLRKEPSQRWTCDQLLEHPFLSHCYTPIESSPRCVLDWVNSEFEDEEEERDSATQWDEMTREISAKDRIGKLVTTRGKIWESDGWMAVRDSTLESPGVDCSESEEAGRNAAYLNLTRVELETESANSVYSWESVRRTAEERKAKSSKWDFRNFGGNRLQEREGGKMYEFLPGRVGLIKTRRRMGGFSCQYGSGNVGFAVEERGMGLLYWMCSSIYPRE
ncbi:mitogen-activated protein kinase kinase kinase 18-like [Carica papaya]|uniref:mitogen-activated protein kinase kinase kinase 18-like n=1 Tax=Carica papaya TaxID=3649 RepID=UPI000B8CE8B7|nr:mitogen-activated protein kinase kinase kinase 18-like [Carica papaya]